MRQLVVGTGYKNVGRRNKYETIGIDICRFYLYDLKRKITDDAFSFCVADACNIPFRDEIFTKVLCKDVLEHINSPGKAVEEMCRVIEKGGLLLLQVPRAESEYFLYQYFRPYREFVIGKEHKHIFTKIELPYGMNLCQDCITDAFGGLYWFLIATFYNAVGLDSKAKINATGSFTFIDENGIKQALGKLLHIFANALAFLLAPSLSIVIPKKSKLGILLYKSRQIVAKKM